MIIPTNYTDFLYWFKERTETFWSNQELLDEDDTWILGAKWVGMKDAEILEVEKRYNFQFTAEHREFLKILHTIDRKQPVKSFDSEWKAHVKLKPYFYNWLTDDEDLNYRFSWSYVEILHDVKNGFWLESWGKRPQSETEIEAIFSNWYNQAPRLIPIFGHRFVVNLTNETKSPVLSVWGSDTIIYGWSLKHYLLNELGQYLNLWESVYDEEDDQYYPKDIKELQDYNNQEWLEGEQKGIPYWYELILHASPNWQYTPV